MPRVVDSVERRRLILEAVFRLVESGGVEAASLRNVAAESGFNIGSVRHYFDSHETLLISAVREMAERVAARIERRIPVLAGARDATAFAEGCVDMLEELLPLDGERRQEVIVWLAFTERSRVTPALREAAHDLVNGSRDLTRPLLEQAGVPHPEVASEALASVVDGLAIAMLHRPDDFPPSLTRDILRFQVACSFTDVPVA